MQILLHALTLLSRVLLSFTFVRKLLDILLLQYHSYCLSSITIQSCNAQIADVPMRFLGGSQVQLEKLQYTLFPSLRKPDERGPILAKAYTIRRTRRAQVRARFQVFEMDLKSPVFMRGK
jgi:hypothetical protein